MSLASEMREAVEMLSDPQRAELLAHGVSAALIGRYSLIGAAKIRVGKSRLYEPASDGKFAYLTPVLVDNTLTPEALEPGPTARVLGHLVDLVAWHPRHPSAWALRAGAAEWLGCVEPQYMHPAPVSVRRSPLAWLRAGCEGLVILSDDPPDVYRVLSGLGSIVAEDQQHAAELRRMVRRPWPLPRIVAAENGVQHAAA